MLVSVKITIPIVNQSDLDKAVEILDRSAHLTSLRIFLSQANGVVEKVSFIHISKHGSSQFICYKPQDRLLVWKQEQICKYLNQLLVE